MTTKIKLLQEFDEDLTQMEKNLLEITGRSNRIYNKTTQVMNVVFSIIGLLVVINLYFIYDFSKDVIQMVKDMDNMYNHFGVVTDNMHIMTEDVSHMGTNIALMPKIADKMSSMNHSVKSMTTNVGIMDKKVALMRKDVGSINSDMTNMSYRFKSVNNSMNRMVYDVNQMSDVIP